MGYLDSSTNFSSAQSAFASNADVASTNILDLNPNLATNAAFTANPGPGSMKKALIQVTTAFTGGTSMKVVLQTDTNTNFSTAMVEAAMTDAIPVASLTVNKQIELRFSGANLKRYIRLVYRNVGSNTTGAVSSWITESVFMPGATSALSGFTVN